MSSSSIFLELRQFLVRLLTLAALAPCVCLEPAFALNPNRLMGQYSRDRWTEGREFPGGAVYAFAQTPDGALWIAAERGLVRFDGLNFQLFNHANTPALSDSPVADLVIDGDGAVWIRMQSREVVRYHGGAFEAVPQPTPVTAMTRGPTGEVILVRSNEAVRYRGESFTTLPHPSGSRLTISAAVTSDGVIWAGTRDLGLFGLKQGRVFQVRGLPDRKVNRILPGEGNALWVGTDRGLAKWDASTITQQGLPPVLETAQVLTLARDRDGNLWLGTPHGLMRMTARGQVTADSQTSGRTDQVNAIFEDREGDLWVGGTQGIERYRDSAFLTYAANAGAADAGGPVYVDRTGRLWEGPPSGGLSWLQDGRWQSVAAGDLIGDVVYSIDGGADDIWLGRQRGGLTRLRMEDSAVAETLSTADGLAKGSIYSVHRSRDGAVWAGSLGGGVSRVRNGRVTTYTTADGLASNTISAIEEGADGTMWFATPNGLSAFAQERWRSFAARDGLPPGRINCLTADSSGVLWIGTDMGLAFVRGSQAQTPRDLPASLVDQILGIADDGHDGLWIATSKFVARLSRSHLMGAAAGPGPVRIFGLADGIPVPEGVRRDRSVVRDSAGRIWFSLRRGVSLVDPARIGDASAPPVVHIESATADGSALDPVARARVPAGQHRIRFEYQAISLSVPELVRYRYRLDGFDRDWSEPLAGRETFYTNLGPGAYRFRVIAGNREGVWSTTESSVTFDVVPALWQTFWVQALAVISGCLCWLLLYRLRLRRVKRLLAIRFEERLAERTRIGQELHDTLLQGLLAASMQIHLAVDTLPTDSAARPRFDRALAMLRQVVDEGRHAVRGLRSPGTGAHELEAAFSKVREEFADAKSIDVRIVVDGKSRPLNPLVRDEIYGIGREALANAFRHSGSPTVEMHIEYDGHLRVAVRDCGRGFDEEALCSRPNGHSGLIGMRDKAERMGAQLDVRSRSEAGTEIVLTVPGPIAFPTDDPGPRHRWAWRP